MSLRAAAMCLQQTSRALNTTNLAVLLQVMD